MCKWPEPHRSPRRPARCAFDSGVFAVLLLTLAACRTRADGDAPVVPRPGASLVFDMGRRDFSGATPLSSSWPRLSLVDVAKDGDLVVATLFQGADSLAVFHPSSDPSQPSTIGSAGASASYLIMASTDGGASWTSKQLKGLERDQHLEGRLMGIHAAKGRAVLVARRRIENPMGTQITYPAAEIDLAGDAWVPNSWLDQDEVFAGTPWVAGAFLRSAKVLAEDRTGKVLAAISQEYDLQARVLTRGPIAPLPPCEPYKLEPALDGSIAMGACMAGPPLKLCQVSLGIAASQADCWQQLRIPGSLKMSREAVTTPAGVFLVLGDGQNSWAVRLSSAGSPSMIAPLGAGEYFSDDGLHPTWAGLVHLNSGRLIDLSDPANPQEVLLPATPCADGESCGTASRLVRTVSLGSDDYLDFYWVDTFQGGTGTHPMLYATRDRAQRRAVTGAAPRPVVDGPIPAYPAAQPVTPLDRQCMALERCLAAPGGGSSLLWRDCLPKWLIMKHGSPEVAKFLAASPTDCTALKAAAAVLNPLRAAGKSGCDGDILQAGVAPSIDCTRYGSRCVVPEGDLVPVCSDGSSTIAENTCTEKGSAVEKISGALVAHVCSRYPGYSCQIATSTAAPRPACGLWDCSPPSHCEGDVAVTCGSPGSKSDCSLQGLTCLVKDGNPMCGTTAPKTSLDADVCLDDYLVYVGIGDVARYIDCTEIGGHCDPSFPQRQVCR